MSLDARALFNVAASHLAALGLFDRVAAHEPENAPGNGLTVAVSLAPAALAPVPTGSGLGATTARLGLQIQIFCPMTREPADDIDPTMLDAASQVLGAFSGDFDFGGLARNVDALGQAGVPLQADAGYVQIDGQTFRVATITLPVLVNDVWEQVP